jgi:type I pantothenate kinase
VGQAVGVVDDDAYRRLAERVAALRAGSAPPPPVLFGVAGGVAAGKSTTAGALRRHLEAGGCTVALLATDAFLWPNEELERRGLTMRKGFPESYDADALVAVLRALEDGRAVGVPVYSHRTYDRLPGEVQRVDPATDVVLVEGVNVLQADIAAELTASVYVDAAEEDARTWFFRRFMELCEAARDDPSSFYAPLASLGEGVRRSVADAAWEGVNLVNLREHIAPTCARATWVLRKGSDHSVTSLDGP